MYTRSTSCLYFQYRFCANYAVHHASFCNIKICKIDVMYMYIANTNTAPYKTCAVVALSARNEFLTIKCLPHTATHLLTIIPNADVINTNNKAGMTPVFIPNIII